MVLPRVHPSLSGIAAHCPRLKFDKSLSASLAFYRPRYFSSRHSGHILSHRLSGHLSKHRSRHFSRQTINAKPLSGYQRLLSLSQPKSRSQSRRNGKDMDDIITVRKSPANSNNNSTVNSKRKREHTKPRVFSPKAHVNVEKAFEQAPQASGSSLLGRVDAGDTHSPSMSPSTAASVSKGRRRAKAARRVDPTGTATIATGDSHVQTNGIGKGKGKMKEDQPAQVETESSIKGNVDHVMGMPTNMAVNSAVNMDVDHGPASLPHCEQKAGAQEEEAKPATQQPKVKTVKTIRNTIGAGAEPREHGQMQTWDPSALRRASGPTPIAEPTPVPQVTVASQTLASSSTPARPHPPPNSNTNPNSTSNPNSDSSLGRSIRFFTDPSTGRRSLRLPSAQSSNPTPSHIQPQNQLHPRLQAEALQLVRQLDNLPLPSTSYQFASASQAAFAGQPMQSGSHLDARPHARGQPPHHSPFPPYYANANANIYQNQPGHQREREWDRGKVNPNSFARGRSGGSSASGSGSGRGVPIGRGGHAYMQRQGAREAEAWVASGYLGERIRINDDTSPASRRVLQMREDVRRRVQSAVQRAFGSEYRVEFFGSTRYGVSFSDSDLDMAILDPHHPQGYTETKLEDPIYNSRKLANCIRKARFVAIETRARSTVPIVKFKDPITSLECDLNVNSTLGLINSDMIKAYISLYPPLKSLIFEIKEWAKPLGLNSPAGTKEVPVSWSSYSLVGMAVAWCMNQGLLPNLQAGLPPLRSSSASSTRPLSRNASEHSQNSADFVMGNARAEPEADLHIHLADSGPVVDAPAVEPSVTVETTPSNEMTVGQDQLVWTLKPHRGWDARYWTADAPSVQAEMRAIAQTVDAGRRSGKQLFAEWLLFWSTFDFKRQAVCMRLPGGIVDRDSPEVRQATHRDRQLPAAICVVDPFIRSKNCTMNIAPKTLERFKAECAREAIVQASATAFPRNGNKNGN